MKSSRSMPLPPPHSWELSMKKLKTQIAALPTMSNYTRKCTGHLHPRCTTCLQSMFHFFLWHLIRQLNNK
jgi:hypothetical protein